MRAILIDAVNHTVTEIQHKGDLDGIYRSLNVEMIEVGHYDQETGDTMYVDEDAKLKKVDYGFVLFGKDLIGSGIIFGSTPEGENASAVTDLKTIKPIFFKLERV
jgi:hypothetical protein